MSFEPQKFFIGVIDFFAVLLPGALLTFFLGQNCKVAFIHTDSDSGIWVAAFLFSSYVLGHFAFSVGSLLDRFIYDPLSDAAEAASKRKSDRNRKWHPLPPLERLAHKIFKFRYWQAMHCVELIKKHYLDRLDAADATNVFQWCKARLALDSDVGLATVQRFEADSKFFRSFVITLLVLLALRLASPDSFCAIDPQTFPTVLFLVLLPLALWRYFDQRTKATIYAMLYVITAESRRPDGYRSQPLHAGGVVRRGKGKSTEYLLVQATKNPNEWVLPKGHIEAGELPEAAAVREVREETGVSARINKPLGRIVFVDDDGSKVFVQFFLMEARGNKGPPAELREHKWLSLADALRQVTHLESKGLLASQLP